MIKSFNPSEKGTVRLAAIADIHCNKNSHDMLRPLFSQISETADILLLGGDLVDYGLPEEAVILAKEIEGIKLPVVGVLGNHEFESGKQEEVCRILSEAGAVILDGDAYEIGGIGFAGVKGFAGGFGERALQPWGEQSIKSFVHEAIGEALKLESALAKLRTDHRIALLHYSPIESTVKGEPVEIYPFLGSSRLEEPLNRYPVTAVFHGHAHHGTPEGRTKGDVPVYNVATKLLQRVSPGSPPFKVIELPLP
ncbi:MAG TPA: metallophosphoesterase [Candidatus Udaeobacter sp.]|nr:metallophosphoesterase [Candidatus Udaeobacter sp.]